VRRLAKIDKEAALKYRNKCMYDNYTDEFKERLRTGRIEGVGIDLEIIEYNRASLLDRSFF
jgi:hypothetical protein